MKKCEHFFHGSPVPRKRGKGFFPYKVRDFARAKRDKTWVRGKGRAPSGVNTGFWVAAKREVAGLALLQCLYEVLLQGGDGGRVGQRAVFAVGEVEGVFDFFAVGADFGVADVDVVREQDAADV